MNTFTKTEVFLSVFVQKRSSVNGASDLDKSTYTPGIAKNTELVGSSSLNLA